MKLNQQGKLFIIKHEGVASKSKDKNLICNESDIKDDILIYPYKCSAGRKTIGVGCVINHCNYDKGVKISETMELFEERLEEFENGVNALNLNLNQNQFNSLASFVFNLGNRSLQKSTLLKKIREDIKNKAAIQAEFLKWNKIHGIENKAIEKRRQTECDLFFTAVQEEIKAEIKAEKPKSFWQFVQEFISYE